MKRMQLHCCHSQVNPRPSRSPNPSPHPHRSPFTLTLPLILSRTLPPPPVAAGARAARASAPRALRRLLAAALDRQGDAQAGAGARAGASHAPARAAAQPRTGLDTMIALMVLALPACSGDGCGSAPEAALFAESAWLTMAYQRAPPTPGHCTSSISLNNGPCLPMCWWATAASCVYVY